MPRISKSWTAWDPGTAVEFNKLRDDFDELYGKWSDRMKVYRLSADPALQITIGAGIYRVGTVEWNYAGGTLTVGASVTTYIMINSSGVIQTSTSAWNGQYARLAIVVSGASTITSITLWRNDLVGGDFWGNPTGIILLWTTGSAPTGYLLCDGTAVSRTTYAWLFSLVSTTYWVGDGSTTFNLPNLKGRVPVGFDSSQTEFDSMGETGGAKTHTIATTEMPVHRHNVPLDAANAAANTSLISHGGSSNPFGTKDTSDTGGGQSHNNLQPYLVLNYIIKT